MWISQIPLWNLSTPQHLMLDVSLETIAYCWKQTHLSTQNKESLTSIKRASPLFSFPSCFLSSPTSLSSSLCPPFFHLLSTLTINEHLGVLKAKTLFQIVFKGSCFKKWCFKSTLQGGSWCALYSQSKFLTQVYKVTHCIPCFISLVNNTWSTRKNSEIMKLSNSSVNEYVLVLKYFTAVTKGQHSRASWMGFVPG